MKYLKKFENNAAYNAVLDTLETPNVSYSVEEGKVYYNPDVEYKITIVVNTSNANQKRPVVGNNNEQIEYISELETYTSNIESIVIDDANVPLSSLEDGFMYTFTTPGDHTVVYYLKSSNTISGQFLGMYLKSVTFENIKTLASDTLDNCNAVTLLGTKRINAEAFSHVTLTNLPDTVEYISVNAFLYECTTSNDQVRSKILNIEPYAFGFPTVTGLNTEQAVKENLLNYMEYYRVSYPANTIARLYNQVVAFITNTTPEVIEETTWRFENNDYYAEYDSLTGEVYVDMNI